MLFTTEFEVQLDIAKKINVPKKYEEEHIVHEKARFTEGAALSIAKSVDFKEMEGYGDLVRRFRHRVHVFKEETVELFQKSLLEVAGDSRYTDFQRKEMVKDLLRQFLNTL